jgi:Flp pilus assembly protein TadG
VFQKQIQGRSAAQRERGQIIIMVGLATIVMFGIVGLAVDVGRLYVTRVELGRSLDAAALSGILELDGTTAGVSRAEDKALQYFYDNEPNATANAKACNGDSGPPCNGEVNTLVMTADKSINMIFLSVLGIHSASVTSRAKAGFGTQYVDAVVMIDTTGSMNAEGSYVCNSSQDGPSGICKIHEAKQAARAFADILLGNSTGNVQIGVGAYRGCFNPPRADDRCISSSWTTNLSSNLATVRSGIDPIYAINGPGQPTGGSGTNQCLALKKGQDILMGPGAQTEPETKRYLILLTDGNNVYNAGVVNQDSPQSPESPCRPTNPTTNDGSLSSACRTASNSQQARKVDVLAYNQAQAMKAQGIEIFVVGLMPCGTHNNNLCDTSILGTALSDAGRNENLMKCMASSNAGTNDHYYYTTNAADLPAIFTAIANQIAHRLLE